MANCNFCTVNNKCPGFDDCPHMKGGTMPRQNEFDVISENAKIEKSNRIELCILCGNDIPVQEKFLGVTIEDEDARPGSGDYAICKNCIRLAAKRLGLMR
jgi:hypothetical protein